MSEAKKEEKTAKADPKMTLVKFGALACGPCRHMEKVQTLEKFVEKHPNVEIKKYETADAEWETPKGSPFAEADKIANRKKVTSLPTLIFEDSDGKEILRHEGGISLRDLERMYLDALDEVAPPDEDDDEEETEDD